MSSLKERMSGAGMETLDSQESMPLLKVLNKLSPEVDADDEKYIDGAKPGDILFAFDQRILEQPVEFVVLAQRSCYAEWRPRSEGGGFVAHHPRDIIEHPDYKKGSDKSEYDEFLGSNELIFTMYYMIKFKDGNDDWTDAVLAFTKAQLRSAGRLLARLIRRFKYKDDIECVPATFSRSYLLKTFQDKNDQGKWYNFSVEPGHVFDFDKDEDVLTAFLDRQEEAIKALPEPREHRQLSNGSEAEVVGDDDAPF